MIKIDLIFHEKINALLDRNKDILWYEDFIREAINKILEKNVSKNKSVDGSENGRKKESKDEDENFNQKDINLVKRYSDRIKKYHDILIENWIDVSIWITRLLIAWQTEEEFNKSVQDETNKSIIEKWKTENIKLFFGEKWITKLNSFQENYESKKKLKDLVINWNTKIIKLLFKKIYNIKNSEELDKLFNKSNWSIIQEIIIFWNIENINTLFSKKFYDIKESSDLDNLIKNPYWNQIRSIIVAKSSWVIKLLFEDIYNINNKEKLEELFRNNVWNKIQTLITFWKTENIKLFFKDIYDIKNNNDLTKLTKNPYWEKIVDLMKYWNIENIKLFFEDIYEIKNKENLEELFDNKNWNVIQYFIKCRKTENIKHVFGKKWIVKDSADIDKLSRFKFLEDFKEIITSWETANIKLIFGNNRIINNTEAINKLFWNLIWKWTEHWSIVNIIKLFQLIDYWESKNIELFFSKKFYNINWIKELKDLISSPIWDKENRGIEEFIIFWNHNIILKLFSENFYNINNKKDFEDLLNNKNWYKIKDLIINWKYENLKLFLSEEWTIKNKTDLELLFKSEKYPIFETFIKNWIKSEYKYINELIKDNYDIRKISINIIRKYFFAVTSQGSRVLNYLLDRARKEEKDIYTQMQKIVVEYLEQKSKTWEVEEKELNYIGIQRILDKFFKKSFSKIEHSKLNIPKDKIELSIYLRYWHTVDYPEIWELILLFVNEYINRKYSAYISGIRLIPRHENLLPRVGLLNMIPKIRTYRVMWLDFERSLGLWSVQIHLSHGTVLKTGMPQITSCWISKEDKHIQLSIDLEENYDKNNTKSQNIEEIFNSLFNALQQVDKQFDKMFNWY